MSNKNFEDFNYEPGQLRKNFSFKNSEIGMNQINDQSSEISSIKKNDDEANMSFQYSALNSNYKSNFVDRETQLLMEGVKLKFSPPKVSYFGDKKSDLSEIPEEIISKIKIYIINNQIEKQQIQYEKLMRIWDFVEKNQMNLQLKMIQRSLECEKFLLKHDLFRINNNSVKQDSISNQDNQIKNFRNYFLQTITNQNKIKKRKQEQKLKIMPVNHYKLNIETLSLTLNDFVEEKSQSVVITNQQPILQQPILQKKDQKLGNEKKTQQLTIVPNTQFQNLDFSKLYQKVDQEILLKFYQHEQQFQQLQQQQSQVNIMSKIIQNPYQYPQSPIMMSNPINNLNNQIFNSGNLFSPPISSVNPFTIKPNNQQSYPQNQFNMQNETQKKNQSKVYNTRSGQH